MGKMLDQKYIVSRIANAYMEQSFLSLTLFNMEVHLEDLNILADDNVDFTLPNNKCLVAHIEHMAERFNDLGYEKSFLIMNAMRFLFDESAETELSFTAKSWLELTRIIVGTINTTMRYRKDAVA